ncbi:MAG: SusC/RagA family TonB-linked outer membrane protein, partial [Tannerella sp.]|nr:SusC/RagA family TonB-linked outer membrane protein [Tannerella sp.]
MTFLISLLFTSGVFAIETHSQVARVSISAKSVSYREVLSAIERQTDYLFVYEKNEIDLNKKVKINAHNKTVAEVLSTIFQRMEIVYAMEGSNIMLMKRGEDGLIRLPARMQQRDGRRVTGTVIDENGEPVIGANVVEKGTTNGTVTDVDGKFSVSVSEKAVLQVSYIGYIGQEITVGNQTGLSITLKEDFQNLEEVVVVGYGVVKKRDLTGSVASVNADKIAEIPATTATQAMQGRIAGILINNTSTQPGASPSVFIRGKRSISGGSDPLYVVDGIAITGGLNEINPADIESIDVLKDASATAIYGARGSNGVVMITTKKGRDGKTQVEYNGYAGFETVLNELRYMDGGEFTEYVREAYRANNKYASDTPNWELDQQISTFRNDPYTLESVHMGYDANGNFNPANVRADSRWWDAIERKGAITNHQVSIRGGNNKTQFNFSGSYFDE